MSTTLLKIITPDEIVFDGKITMVTVKTISGYRGILPNHAPLISLISTGNVNIYTENNNKPIKYNIFNGILIVEKKMIKILTDNIIKS